jgi:uridine kinase
MNLTLNALTDKIRTLQKPILVGISGFGGSGKSTLALALGNSLEAPIVGVDAFSKSTVHEGYEYWDIMDFDRLEKEVLKPFVSGSESMKYGNFNWESNSVDSEVTIAHGGILIVEGVGLFRPSVMKYFSWTIWIDCPIEEAIACGKKRERERNNNRQDEYWDGIWKKNDIQCFERFSPKTHVDLIIDHTTVGEIFIA